MKTEKPVSPDRRELLFEILKKSGQIMMATNVIYSVSHFTSKNGNTAGAK